MSEEKLQYQLFRKGAICVLAVLLISCGRDSDPAPPPSSKSKGVSMLELARQPDGRLLLRSTGQLFTGLQYAIILLSPSSEGIIGCFVRRSAKYRHLSIFRNLCVWFIIFVSSIITRRNSIIAMAIAWTFFAVAIVTFASLASFFTCHKTHTPISSFLLNLHCVFQHALPNVNQASARLLRRNHPPL